MARIGRWTGPCLGALVALSAALTTGAPRAVATGDVEAPILRFVDVTPDSADITTAAKSFTVTFRITDDLSGLDDVDLSYSINNGGFGVQITRTGSDLDATYTGTFTVPRYSYTGRYSLFVYARDRVGNVRSYNTDDLAAAGFETGVDVTGPPGDTTAPTVTGVQVNPGTVDVRTEPATAEIEVTATDAESGIGHLFAFLVVPGGSSNGGVQGVTLARVSGTPTAGVWRGTFTLPMHIRNGQWTLAVRALDSRGNRVDLDAADLVGAGLVSTIQILSEEDITPPLVSELTIEPAEVNVHDADRTVTVRLRISDAGVGLASNPTASATGSSTPPATSSPSATGPTSGVPPGCAKARR